MAGIRIALGIGALLVTVARTPWLWSSPRFWAEEGSFYFDGALRLPWWQALVATPSGYLLVVVSGATLLAAQVDLVVAPLVTTGIALVLQLLPIVLVLLAAEDTWWLTPRWRLAFVVILIAVMPPEEIWLTTFGSPWFLSLATGLVLLLPTVEMSAAFRWLARVTLGLAGLSSVPAAALAPLFVLEAARTREQERGWQAMLLSGAAAAQLGTVLAVGSWRPSPARPGSGDLGIVLGVVAKKSLAELLLGPLDRALGLGALDGFERWDAWPVTGATLAAGVALVALGIRAWRRQRGRALEAVLAYLIFMTVSLLATATGAAALAIDPYPAGGRYFYAPGVILIVAIVMLEAHERRAALRQFFRGVLAVVLMQVVVSVIVPVPGWGLVRGPAWTEQVAAWRRGSQPHVMVWPAGWFLVPPSGRSE